MHLLVMWQEMANTPYWAEIKVQFFRVLAKDGFRKRNWRAIGDALLMLHPLVTSFLLSNGGLLLLFGNKTKKVNLLLFGELVVPLTNAP